MFCLCNEISRDLFINCKVNILVVICEKLNFQNSKVYELGKNLENRIFGILELNISMERLPIRDFWAITAAWNSNFTEKVIG